MYTYEEIKINPVKAIDNEIAKNPQAHTILPEIRDVVYCLQKEITDLKNKLSRRNMQIKDLKRQIREVKLETLKNCRCLLGSVSPEKAAIGLELDIKELTEKLNR